MKTYVSFESDFSSERTVENPPGEELSQYLYENFVTAGFQVNEPKNREDWAWDFLLKTNSCQIESIVSYVNDWPIQWLLTTHLHYPPWKMFLADSVIAQAESDLQDYCQTIHKSLSNNRFWTVRWYDIRDFNNNETEYWSPSPLS